METLFYPVSIFFEEFFPAVVEKVIPFIFVYTAFAALRQIKLIREQNSISRESVAIYELRKFQEFLESYEYLREKVDYNNKDLGLDLLPVEMEGFSFSELKEEKNKVKFLNWKTFYDKNPELFKFSINCSNKLEVIATALNKGTAKLDIIQITIAMSFCQFVEYQAYIYVINRNKAFSLYVNTIDLYKKFKPITKTVEEQRSLRITEIEEIFADKKTKT